MKFRKKPVVIEAMQLPPVYDIDGRLVFDDWIVKAQGYRKCRYVGDKMKIPTLEGEMIANPRDWIIRGVKGEIYPCKPDIFAATYEPVTDTPARGGDGG